MPKIRNGKYTWTEHNEGIVYERVTLRVIIHLSIVY